MATYALTLCARFGQLESLDEFTRLHDQLATGVCQSLVEFYTIVSAESMFLSESARTRIPALGNELAAMYGRLSSMCYERGQRLWKISPKLHLFLHLCLHQATSMGNPRFWWCYGDEDLVRIMINVADSVHPKTLAISVLSKWLWCVFDELIVED